MADGSRLRIRTYREVWRETGKAENTGEAAGKHSQELGDIGFFGLKNLKTQIKDGKEVTVSYTADTISGFGGFSWKLRAEGKSRVIDPVGWIRKIKAAEDIFSDAGGR